MELHQGKPKDEVGLDLSSCSVEELFLEALHFTEFYYTEQLDEFRRVNIEDLTPHKFWTEYIWCVYTSGFSAKVVSSIFPRLMNAYGPWDWTLNNLDFIYGRVRPIFSNLKKCGSIVMCRTLLSKLGWDKFKAAYCTDPLDLQDLPFIGKVTCYHLARNLGIDAVKPDLHLVRLADHYGYGSPEEMCSYLSGLSGERIGVVDYVLWSYSAAFGTKELAV